MYYDDVKTPRHGFGGKTFPYFLAHVGGEWYRAFNRQHKDLGKDGSEGKRDPSDIDWILSGGLLYQVSVPASMELVSAGCHIADDGAIEMYPNKYGPGSDWDAYMKAFKIFVYLPDNAGDEYAMQKLLHKLGAKAAA